MNFKKIGKSLISVVIGIFVLAWLWQWVRRQGGIMRVFNNIFPDLGLTPAQVPIIRPTPEIVIPGAPRRTPRIPITEESAPILRPTPTPTPTPTPPRAGNVKSNDRLPWENNRTRYDIISALRADIARIERYPRETANTFTEVARVGGVTNYLNLQRARLTRALSEPVTSQLVPAPRTQHAPPDVILPMPPSPFTPIPVVSSEPTFTVHRTPVSTVTTGAHVSAFQSYQHQFQE